MVLEGGGVKGVTVWGGRSLNPHPTVLHITLRSWHQS